MTYNVKIHSQNHFKVGINTSQVFDVKYHQVKKFKVVLNT